MSESPKLQPRSEVIDTPTAALAAVRRMAQDVRPARMHVLVRTCCVEGGCLP